jgi:nicotinamidase-related amidase
LKKILVLFFTLVLLSAICSSQQKEELKKMNKALLIVDIQNDYFSGGTMELVNSEQAGLNAGKILNKFRKDGLPVIYIKHIAVNSNAAFFKPDTKGAEINSCVKPNENEKIFVKHFPNSFRDTGLLEYLKSQNITDLVICGMMTHMCIDATTRAAKDYGFNIILIGDACATRGLEINGQKVKAEDVHNSFLAALNNSYSLVKTTEQYLNEK